MLNSDICVNSNNVNCRIILSISTFVVPSILAFIKSTQGFVSVFKIYCNPVFIICSIFVLISPVSFNLSHAPLISSLIFVISVVLNEEFATSVIDLILLIISLILISSKISAIFLIKFFFFVVICIDIFFY